MFTTPIIISASHFIQRTSENRRVKEIRVEGFDQVFVVLEREKITLAPHWPKAVKKEQLAAYLNQSHFVLSELSDGSYHLTTNLRLCGGGNNPSKRAPPPAQPRRVVMLTPSVRRYSIMVADENQQAYHALYQRLFQCAMDYANNRSNDNHQKLMEAKNALADRINSSHTPTWDPEATIWLTKIKMINSREDSETWNEVARIFEAAKNFSLQNF